jgi:hypothetical protein
MVGPPSQLPEHDTDRFPFIVRIWLTTTPLPHFERLILMVILPPEPKSTSCSAITAVIDFSVLLCLNVCQQSDNGMNAVARHSG